LFRLNLSAPLLALDRYEKARALSTERIVTTVIAGNHRGYADGRAHRRL